MELITIIEIIKTIGGVCGAIITITTLITLLLKKPKQWLQKAIKEQFDEENKEIKNLLSNIDKKIETNREASLAALRHEITAIYDLYYPQGHLPVNVRKDLISLYDAYRKNGGNSYAEELYNELINLNS